MTTLTGISFFVPGIAKTAGSKKSFRHAKTGKIITLDDCDKSEDWKVAVRAEAYRAMSGDIPFACPVSLVVEFRMQRPRYHYGTGRNASKLKPSAPEWHATKPDATKLLRCIEDAMTGIVWADDAQVVRQEVAKTYSDKPGAMVSVCPMA